MRRARKDLGEVVGEIREAIENSPKKTKRVLLKTLLTTCGFAVKTKERAAALTAALSQAGIAAFPSVEEAGREDWIVLSLLNPQVPVLPPSESAATTASEDPWFDQIAEKPFGSEREVEIRFVIPLLERLGYTEEDRADGFPVEIYEGVRKAIKEADFVLFEGPQRTKDVSLLVVEAKTVGKKLTDYIGQARTYAIWLGTPYYLVTNADEIRVFLYRSPIESDVEVFAGTRQTLRSSFANLYNLISREAIIEYKRRRTASVK